MFGLSIGKLLVIIAVIVIAWRGLRILNSVQERVGQAANNANRAPSNRTSRESPPQPQAQDLIECPKCGTFVPNGTFCVSKEECRYKG